MMAIITAVQLATLTPQQIVEQMALEEKVGQLFVVPACPDRQDEHQIDLHHLLNDLHVGGILLKQGTQASYKKLLEPLKAYQLLCLGDAEWGVSMRIKDAVRFPRNLTLGAIQDLSLIEAFGRQVGWECRQVGIDLNLAPVADVNSNPKNPVIGTRSFGDNPTEVARRVAAVIRGMQGQEVDAGEKHFPDHGNTFLDSHKDLPKTRIGSLESFEAGIKAGVTAVMTAHLLEETTNEVVTFSQALVHDLLREKLQFKGLIITDALNMGAISKYTKADEAALQALKAGHDVLCYGDHRPEVVDQILRFDVPSAINRIIKAVKEKEIDEALIDSHVVRIIETKQKFLQRKPIAYSPLITKEALELKQKLYDHAVTVVSDQHFPLTSSTPIALTILGKEPPLLNNSLSLLSQSGQDALKVVCVTEWNESIKEKIKNIAPDILIVMASPYGLIDLPKPPTLIIGYENDPMAEESVRKVLFGEMKPLGKLPVKI